MDIFLIIIGMSLIISLLFSCIPWLIHISMTERYSNTCRLGSYRQFKREFDNTNWRYCKEFKYSLFDEEILGDENEYHAGIIKFNGIGMKINNPISYLLVMFYVRKYINNYKARKSGHDDKV